VRGEKKERRCIHTDAEAGGNDKGGTIVWRSRREIEGNRVKVLQAV
jgi:hypothetical protein